MPKKSITEEIDRLSELIESTMGMTPVQKKLLVKQTEQVRRRSKSSKKSDTDAKPAKVSQFQAPRVVDDSMAVFAGWEPGSCHSRVDITNAICQYIKDKNLQNPQNRRIINLDEKLCRLFDIKDATITYPQIQKHIEAHFVAKKSCM